MKPTKHILLLTALLLGSLVVSAHDFEVDGIYYNITSETDLTVEVTFRGEHYGNYNEYTEVTIPATVIYDGAAYNVTSIGEYAFNDCCNLTSIVIPESVTSIGNWAFCGCNSLTSITIPGGVTNIGECAFSSCSSLNSIIIPAGVTSIGNFAFQRCEKLTSISIPKGVISIGGYAFSECRSLVSITIPEGVLSIGDYAFHDCSRLTSVTIPESVTSIGELAFDNTNWYKGQSDGLIYVNNVLYKHKGKMNENTTIELREGTISISPRAFENCENLTSIIIPESVVKIGHYAFMYCSGLTSIIIPQSAKSIEWGAFYGCSGLSSITVPEGVTSIEYEIFRGCSGLISVILPETVTEIESFAFSGCSSLASITIPESVTSIGGKAFQECNSLTSVHINSIESWCKISFDDSSSNPLSYAHNLYQKGELITELVIPDGVTMIGSYVFSGCSSLTSITIPEWVIAIGGRAFYGCTGEVIVNCNIPSASSSDWSVFYGSSFGRVTIGDKVTDIGDFAFSGYSSLTSIVIPESVTSIGSEAFYNCSSLEYIEMNCKTIETWFSGNKAIKEVVLGDGVSMIKDKAFQGCTGLTSIIIGKNVMTIGDPTNTRRGNEVFYGCGSLKEVVFEDGSVTLAVGFNRGKQEGLFYACPLEKVYLGRNLNYDTSRIAGYSPFYNKATLTSLTIGSEVTELGEYAFSGCSAIDTITCHAMTPPTCASDAFSGVDTSIPVYVPEASVADYQAAEVWKDFLNFIGTETGIEHSEIINHNSEMIYDLQGRRVLDTENLRGIYIVNGKKVIFK